MSKEIDIKRFWLNVAKSLLEFGWTWKELANRAGISSQSLAGAKYSNSNLTISTVLKVSRALGKVPSELLFGSRSSIELSCTNLEKLLHTAENADSFYGVLMLLPLFTPDKRKELIQEAKLTARGIL